MRIALHSRAMTLAFSGVCNNSKSTNPFTRPSRMFVILSSKPVNESLLFKKDVFVNETSKMFVILTSKPGNESLLFLLPTYSLIVMLFFIKVFVILPTKPGY